MFLGVSPRLKPILDCLVGKYDYSMAVVVVVPVLVEKFKG